jgi:hypothetical protein
MSGRRPPLLANSTLYRRHRMTSWLPPHRVKDLPSQFLTLYIASKNLKAMSLPQDLLKRF